MGLLKKYQHFYKITLFFHRVSIKITYFWLRNKI
jgi:hypothetical protein